MALRFILATSVLILHVIATPQAQAPLFLYTKAAAAVVQVQEQMLLIFNASSMGIQLEQQHVALSCKKPNNTHLYYEIHTPNE
jgi:hypothetical protein